MQYCFYGIYLLVSIQPPMYIYFTLLLYLCILSYTVCIYLNLVSVCFSLCASIVSVCLDQARLTYIGTYYKKNYYKQIYTYVL
jgi:hypothetical protein